MTLLPLPIVARLPAPTSAQWMRAILLLAFIIGGAIAHMSAMTTGAAGATLHGSSVSSHAEHCTGPACDGGVHQPLECCGGGACACIFQGRAAAVVADERQAKPPTPQEPLTGRLKEGIDRPPKRVAIAAFPHS